MLTVKDAPLFCTLLCCFGLQRPAVLAAYVWQEPQATVTATGDLRWNPKPFQFQTNSSVRYIDFASGNDSNDGRSPQTAWKRHPLDPAASGTAKAGKGIHTYVFKRGVVYRGRLTGADAGLPTNPVRLTSDPAWGSGEAVISGSEIVTGWTLAGAAAPVGMPESNKVYYADVPFFPRCVWVVAGDGSVQRLKLARTPNWNEVNPDDPLSQWWYWQNPNWWRTPNPHYTTNGGTRMHLGVDAAHLTREASYYSNALVWTEWGIVMGTPFPSRVEVVDTAQKALGFQGVWYGDSGTLMRGCRYYLEDKPHYLDFPGEFWAESRPGGARLYVRFPGDEPPSNFRVEAAARVNLVDWTHASNVIISGLTFAFGNVYQDLTARFFVHKDVLGSAIRLSGTGTNLVIRNCRFEHVNMALRLKATADTDRLDAISVTDNEILETDHGAIDISDSSRWAKFQPPFGPLGTVEVLRNRLHNIGQRPARSEWGHAIVISFADSATVAGNILTRAHGAGLFVFGGKGDGQSRDKPFARTLIFQNKVQDSLLKANDWGGIEFWQGGPAYIFNNISANPRGFWHWSWFEKSSTDKVNTKSGLGQAYYLDGGFKCALFNNVAWGKPGALQHPWTACAFQIVLGTENQFFNNTAHHLTELSRTHGAQGGRNHYLGNIASEIPIKTFFSETGMGQSASDLAIETLAFSSNVFAGRFPLSFGNFAAEGTDYPSLATFASALKTNLPLAADVGLHTTQNLFSNAAAADFRLVPGTPAIGRGVRVFIPWALARNVGEWHFRRSPKYPQLVDDNHWFMAPYYVNRADYWKAPRFPLHAVNVSGANYIQGPLEDWCDGALRLNGTNQFLVCSNAPMKQAFTYTMVVNGGAEVTTNASGNQIWSPDIGRESFIIEVVFRSAPGKQGLLVGKVDDFRGYTLSLNSFGNPVLALRSSENGVFTCSWPTDLVDSRWHHLLVEVRRTGLVAVNAWLDGILLQPELSGSVPLATLENQADLLVGGGPGQTYLACDLEFLRISRGSLEESHTTAEELYEWEFRGPFLRDLMGSLPFNRRDAGAIEYQAAVLTNGVPAAWMRSYALAETDEAALKDSDQDGAPNWAEFYAGTSPTDSTSVLRISRIEAYHDGWEIEWVAGTNGSGLPFVVESSTEPGAPASWGPVSLPLTRAASGTNKWISPADPQTRYFRIAVPR